MPLPLVGELCNLRQALLPTISMPAEIVFGVISHETGAQSSIRDCGDSADINLPVSYIPLLRFTCSSLFRSAGR
jgi:hypothetical protein